MVDPPRDYSRDSREARSLRTRSARYIARNARESGWYERSDHRALQADRAVSFAGYEVEPERHSAAPVETVGPQAGVTQSDTTAYTRSDETRLRSSETISVPQDAEPSARGGLSVQTGPEPLDLIGDRR